jgi:hypothetical protein
MRIKTFSGGVAVVELAHKEINIINNALNEVCNGVDLKGEFDTRMGCSLEEAEVCSMQFTILATQWKVQGSPFPAPGMARLRQDFGAVGGLTILVRDSKIGGLWAHFLAACSCWTSGRG